MFSFLSKIFGNRIKKEHKYVVTKDDAKVLSPIIVRKWKRKQLRVTRRNFRDISSVTVWTKEGLPLIDKKLIGKDGKSIVPEIVPEAAYTDQLTVRQEVLEQYSRLSLPIKDRDIELMKKYLTEGDGMEKILRDTNDKKFIQMIDNIAHNAIIEPISPDFKGKVYVDMKGQIFYEKNKPLYATFEHPQDKNFKLLLMDCMVEMTLRIKALYAFDQNPSSSFRTINNALNIEAYKLKRLYEVPDFKEEEDEGPFKPIKSMLQARRNFLLKPRVTSGDVRAAEGLIDLI